MQNVGAPPPSLPDALGHAIKRAVVEDQGKRHDCEAGAGQQLEGFSVLPQQHVLELQQLAVEAITK